MSIKVESQYDTLDYDVIRVPPFELLDRLQSIANAKIDLRKQQEENLDQMQGLSRKDPLYDGLNTIKKKLDTRIKALTTKADWIDSALYLKGEEMRMVAKGIRYGS